MPEVKADLLGGARLNFKDRNTVVPSTIIVVSLAVLLAAFVVGVFVPLPSTNGTAKSPQLQLKDLNHQIDMLTAQQKQSGQTIAQRAWSGSQNDVSAAALADLTAAAKQQGVSVGSFRPQRATDLNGVTELPYAVQLSGSYMGVRQIMRSLDAPSSKVVLRSAQITADTNSTTDVSATLGLSAYVATDPIILAAVAGTKSFGSIQKSPLTAARRSLPFQKGATRHGSS